MHKGSVRVAATFYDFSNPSHIQYYVRKWKDSELVTALPVQDPLPTPARCPTPVEAALSPLLTDIPADVLGSSQHALKQWLLKQAVVLVDMGECSLRAAAEMTNLRYKGEGIPSIAKSSVGNYRSEPSYSPVAPGRTPNIPDAVTDKLVQWIRARRALKFPVFRDDVLATANIMLQGTAILKLFKHGMVDVALYRHWRPTHDMHRPPREGVQAHHPQRAYRPLAEHIPPVRRATLERRSHRRPIR